MTTEFLLPDLGEGLQDAEIVQWLVAAGDEVRLNQTLAEVETAKAVVELPSPYEGVVRELHAEAGETVAVGAPLVSFDVAGESAPEPAAPAQAAAPAAAQDERDEDAAPAAETPAAETSVPQANLVGYGAGGTTTTRPRRRPRVPTAPRAPERIARDLPPRSPAAVKETGGVTRLPIRGVRKHTAEAMVRSAFTAPHASTFLSVDVTSTTELLASLKGDRALDGHRIGMLAVVAKASCLALRRTPELNAHWSEETGEILRFDDVGLGIAVATDRGLVVPHVAAANRLGLVDLADAIGGLVDTARAGRTEPAALGGGTFTITNVGALGVDSGTPILNPGEAGILALGAVRRTPWEHDGQIALRDVVTLSLSFDHRLVDGAEAARFLTDVAQLLRDPGRALLMV